MYRRNILRRDLGCTKANIDGVRIGGIGGIRVSGTCTYAGKAGAGTCPYAGKAGVGNGASVDLELGWDGTMIYRYTNLPNYQLLALSFEQGIPYFEIPAATQYIAS